MGISALIQERQLIMKSANPQLPRTAPPRTALPASAWGADTARIHARIDESLAAADPRDDDLDALYRRFLTTPF